MAGYTKADFYSSYAFHAVDPETRIRYANAQIPEFPGEQITLRLHYHPLVYRREGLRKAQLLIDKGFINDNDVVVILGGAFGWLGEGIEQLNPTVKTISVDTSDYVDTVKADSPNDELIESIEASGYTINDNHIGTFLYNQFVDDTPRAIVPVVKGEITNGQTRAAIRQAVGDATRVITEEMFQLLTQAEKDAITNYCASNNIAINHFIDGVLI